MIIELIFGIIAIPLTIIFLFGRWPSPRTLWYARKIQGPKCIPLVGVAFDAIKLKPNELLTYVEKHLQAFPRITALWLVGEPKIVLQDPKDIEVVFGSVLYITKGFEYNSLRPWLRDGLLTSTGQKWHSRRKMLTPAFHFSVLGDSLQVWNKNAELLAQKFIQNCNQEVQIEPYIKLCTLDIICESVMGVPLGAQLNKMKDYVKAIQSVCEITVQRELKFWLIKDWFFHLTPTGWEYRKQRKIVQSFAEQVIEERKLAFETNLNDPKGKKEKRHRAFLDTMLEYQRYNPGLLPINEIREEVDTFMFEGHDTTSSSLLFTFFLLAAHQEIQEKVVMELDSIFGDSDRSPDMNDLQCMTYLEKVIKESLRLYPSVPYLSRTLMQDLTLDGNIMIPAGVNLAFIPYLLHRDPINFPDPEKFDPERFSEENSRHHHPFSYIPFSAGPRNCIGQKYAMMGMKVILSTILRKLHLETSTRREDIKVEIVVILKPDIPIKIKFTPRKKTN